jgi:DNA polymerase III epsilon subunit-like protein
MKILIIDTETTGLPKNRVSIYNSESWPYIIQLSFILFDVDNLNIIYKFDEYIKISENIDISEESIKIHKITRNKINSSGIDIKYALNTLNIILEMTDLIIGHNISFDKQMLMVEFIRNNILSNLSHQKYFCTMRKYTNLCKIQKSTSKSTSQYKFPKLSELYETLFITTPKELHNSYNDILICLRCYYFIEYNIDLLLSSNDFINEYNKYFNNSLELLSIYN